MEPEAVRRSFIPDSLSRIQKNGPMTISVESLALLTSPSHQHSNEVLSYMTDG